MVSKVKRPRRREYACTNEPVFREVARDVGLNSTDTERFVKFACIWKGEGYPNAHYMSEWAERFKRGTEYIMADEDREAMLVEVDGAYAYKRYKKQLIDWNGNESEHNTSQLNRFMRKHGLNSLLTQANIEGIDVINLNDRRNVVKKKRKVSVKRRVRSN